MPRTRSRRRARTVTGVALALVLAACAPAPPVDDGTGAGATGGTGGTGGSGGGVAAGGCEPFEPLLAAGDLAGTTVDVAAALTPAPSPDEEAAYRASFAEFERCTGATIALAAGDGPAVDLADRVRAGEAPDVALLAPGLLRSLVAADPDAVVPASAAVVADVERSLPAAWRDLGRVDGTLYGAPVGADVTSLLWYSPRRFARAGYEVPTTWAALVALSDRVTAEQPTGKPWCAGVASDEAAGWPATDWLEDAVLRTAGPDVYDQWVAHAIAFDDPRIVAALEATGQVLRNPDYVNAGLGDVASIADTSWQAGGLPVLDGTCWLHRASGSSGALWEGAGDDVEIGPEGDVHAFPAPGAGVQDRPLVATVEIAVAFADRPEVQAFHAFLASDLWAPAMADVSGPGWLSVHSGLDPARLRSPVDRLAHELLTGDAPVLRFDASDLMPPDVGLGSFPAAMSTWLADPSVTESEVLAAVERSWPED